MNYVKKMCILRQLKQGFSGDGKTLSGLVKIEQYGKNLAVEVSIINFAPLALGEYYCLLSDGKGKTEMLALRGKSLFNILSDLDISHGFCAVICYVKNDVVPIAYGINGNGAYDWKTILNATLPPVFPKKQPVPARKEPILEQATAQAVVNAPDPVPARKEPILEQATTQAVVNTPDPVPARKEPNTIDEISSQTYDDEVVADENYFKEQKQDGQELFQKVGSDAYVEGATQSQGTQEGVDLAENDDADDVRHAFTTQSDGYYHSVKTEIDELFSQYPKDDTLKDAFSCSEWARVKGTQENPEYLVGVVYDDGQAKYICYALKAVDEDNPPAEICDVCTFVPVSCLLDASGFFVIFQSAATGACIKPQKI